LLGETELFADHWLENIINDNPAFGPWLAGLTDWEGSFNIKINSDGTPSCGFVISLRVDDIATLQHIHDRLQIGNVYKERRLGEQRAPLTFWSVWSRADCAS
jgi:LAGLIDADG endonuclease